MLLLTQFLLRLSFGLAVGMAITSPRLVSSGYFRNHLYVTLGLTTLAALVAMRTLAAGGVARGRRRGAQLRRLGVLALRGEAGRRRDCCGSWRPASLVAAWVGDGPGLLRAASVVTSGLVLGLTIAAMLLGHWYLNSPGMELAPLRRLLMLMALAVGAQIVVCAIGLVGDLANADDSLRQLAAVRRAALVVRPGRRSGARLDGLADAQNSQHAECHGHSLRRGDRRVRRRIDRPAPVGRVGVSAIIECPHCPSLKQ